VYSYRNALLVLLLLTINVASAQEPNDIRDLGRLRLQLSLLANAAHLHPLSESGADEIRIWFDNYMAGQTTGYIVRDGHIGRCKARFYYNNGTSQYEVRDMSCVGGLARRRAADAFDLVDSVRTFNGKSIACGVLDGWGALIEGVRSGHMFIVEADNPDQCNIPGTKELNAFLGVLK
jgi:hypothetical protein